MINNFEQPAGGASAKKKRGRKADVSEEVAALKLGDLRIFLGDLVDVLDSVNKIQLDSSGGHSVECGASNQFGAPRSRRVLLAATGLISRFLTNLDPTGFDE